MEDIFNKIKKEGRNDADGLIKWIKDSNILGSTKDAEEKLRGLFKESKDQKNVEFAKFKQIVQQVATEQKKNFEDVSKALAEKGPGVLEQLKAGASTAAGAASEATSTAKSIASRMEEVFNNIKKEGKNDVEGLVQWMKESNVLGSTKDAEEKVRGLFKESKDQTNVDFAKFKQIVQQVATEQKKNLDDVTKSMAEKGPGILEQLKAGASKAAEAVTQVAKDTAEAVKKAVEEK